MKLKSVLMAGDEVRYNKCKARVQNADGQIYDLVMLSGPNKGEGVRGVGILKIDTNGDDGDESAADLLIGRDVECVYADIGDVGTVSSIKMNYGALK